MAWILYLKQEEEDDIKHLKVYGTKIQILITFSNKWKAHLQLL